MVIYIGYLAYLVKTEKRAPLEERVGKAKVWDFLIIAGGCVLLIISANLVVKNGISIAEGLGISAYIIGLLVGLGTSLPELAISIAGVKKNSHHISIGNLIGSNITDPLFSLGAGAVLAGFAVTNDILFFDIPFLLLVTLLALVMLRSDNGLDKKEASILILLYILFMGVKFFFFS